MEHLSEDQVRNKPDPKGDSLMEKKKLSRGQDIEPEAEEWVSKTTPTATDDLDS
ncbi:hypothetical protein D3C74_112600 [compost metagenome]